MVFNWRVVGRTILFTAFCSLFGSAANNNNFELGHMKQQFVEFDLILLGVSV